MPANSTHDQYNYWLSDWQMIRDFAAGSRRVKSKGETYLPKRRDMDKTEYEAFKDRAPFLNATARTVAGLVGVVFRRPPRVELGEANKKLEAFLNTITQDGSPFEVLARNVVAETVQMGRYGLLVDMPEAGGRPYIAEYKAEEIINWRQVIRDGRRFVDQVVVLEHIEAPATDGFGTTTSDRWRELRIADGRYEQLIHVLVPEADNGRRNQQPKLVWQATDPVAPVNRGAALAEIPFVFVGPYNVTADVQRPPVLDIVDLNKHHYDKSADLSHGQHYTAIPTYWVSGFVGNEDAQFVAGPTRVWMIPDGGSAGILEFNGQGLTYLENAVGKLQADMAMLGARLIGAQRKTASEASDVVQLRERGEHATLWGIVDSCERALTRALQHWVAWQDGDPSQVRVTLNKDFVDMPMAYRDLLMVMRAYQAGVLPLDAVIEIMYEGDILPSTMKPGDVKTLLKNPSQVYVDPKLAVVQPAQPAQPGNQPAAPPRG